MLGNRFLVVPVLNPGEYTRTVVFTEGKWLDMNYGKIYEKGRYEVPATIVVLPNLKKCITILTILFWALTPIPFWQFVRLRSANGKQYKNKRCR